MKILKVKSREYKGKEYYKYRINIPAELIKDAKLKEGDDLDFEIKNEDIILKKK